MICGFQKTTSSSGWQLGGVAPYMNVQEDLIEQVLLVPAIPDRFSISPTAPARA
jgi:hypothetical protein